MMSRRYEGLFEDREIGVAKNVIREFKGKWNCLRNEDDEDLLQECLAQWLFAKDKYDPAGGASLSTFMARIVRNKLQNLVKEYERDKRKVFHNSTSLDEPLSKDEGASSLLDILPDQTDYRVQTQLKIILSQTISMLTPQQRELCDLLCEGRSSMAELSESLGIERTTVYREIKRIRAVFESHGLKDFLK